MLVVIRELGETIVIGDEITITLLNVVDDQVQIGVNAPESLRVCEEEIYTRNNREHEKIADSKE